MAILRGPLSNPDFKGHFSGHETFPIRHGWLKKVVDALGSKSSIEPRLVFNADTAIAHFGVGKNMVASMKHWAQLTGVIDANSDLASIEVTDFGHAVFDDDGLDPYLEDKGTIWLLQWRIASNAERATTWFWAFNHYGLGFLDRESLIRDIGNIAKELKYTRATATTLKRDVDCFFRTYLPPYDRGRQLSEDALETPLAELELIIPAADKGRYEFHRGPQDSLPDWVLNFAICEFWEQSKEAETLSLEQIAFEPGSPGRVFKIDEASLAARLALIEDTSMGAFRWSETAGMSQLLRTDHRMTPMDFLMAERNRIQTLVAA